MAASRLRNTYFPVVSFFGFLNNLVMLGVGSWLIMRGSEWFTLGALIAYRGFWWRLQSPIRTIAQTSDILQRARASALRVMELLDAAVAIEDSPRATAWDGGRCSVAFCDVAFAYVPGTPILKGLSFDGRRSATSAKTTISLMARSRRTSTMESPMPRTRRSKRRPAQPMPTTSSFRLPAGYQTEVGQNGVKLSGGQRQQLSLARAFLTRPRILLLDEPTASVEPESEALIHESILARTREGRGTTLLVTHSVDLLRQAPRILFLEGGLLVGNGRHDDLVSSCPEYADAYHRWEVREEITAGQTGLP